MRTLLILLAIAAIILVVRRLLTTPRKTSRRATPAARMVQCAHCGIYVPEAEAVRHQGRNYCSAAHRDAASP
jgi:uncharacterized protein